MGETRLSGQEGAAYENGAESGIIVTVVVPNHNCAGYLEETLESIAKSQGIPLEVIVVDDASTDNSREILSRPFPWFQHFKVIYLEHNTGGPAKPRNIGIRSARGKYICFVDSDDLILPETLREAVAFHEQQPGLGLVFFDAIKFDDEHGNYPEPFLASYSCFRGIEKKQIGTDRFLIQAKQAHEALFYENYVQTPGVVTIRRDVFRHVGFFDESLSSAEDWDLWFRISKKYDIAFIDQVGLRYRVREGSIEHRGMNRLAMDRIRVLRKQLDTKDLPAAIRKQAIRLIAKNYYGVGFHHQSHGNMTEARRQYLNSLMKSASWRAAKGLLITFLGHDIYTGLKKIKYGAQEHT